MIVFHILFWVDDAAALTNAGNFYFLNKTYWNLLIAAIEKTSWPEAYPKSFYSSQIFSSKAAKKSLTFSEELHEHFKEILQHLLKLFTAQYPLKKLKILIYKNLILFFCRKSALFTNFSIPEFPAFFGAQGKLKNSKSAVQGKISTWIFFAQTQSLQYKGEIVKKTLKTQSLQYTGKTWKTQKSPVHGENRKKCEKLKVSSTGAPWNAP